MATIVSLELDDGAVIAGDRLLTAGGTVESESKRHVFDFGEVGAAAVGSGAAGGDSRGESAGGVDTFQRKLESEVESHETEHGESMNIDRLASVASHIATEEGVEAIVVAHDGRGTARTRGIGADGGTLTDTTQAFGSGSQFALGVLEQATQDLGLDDAEALARDAIETAADRDTGTGGEVDAYLLENDSQGR